MTELVSIVQTTRFGELEIAPPNVLVFPDGLVGLPGNDYALIAAGNGPFTWLQSMSDPAIALPLTNPHRFFDFTLEVSESEGQRLGLDAEEAHDVYVTVRAARQAADCTANLRAPILVVGEPGEGSRRAYQVLNQAPGVTVRAALFPRA